MTEEEAKTKWCCGPFLVMGAIAQASMLSAGVTPEEIDNAIPRRGFCIGPDCMAWRKTDNELQDENDVPDGAVLEVMPAGYCGLAGNPRDR